MDMMKLFKQITHLEKLSGSASDILGELAYG